MSRLPEPSTCSARAWVSVWPPLSTSCCPMTKHLVSGLSVPPDTGRYPRLVRGCAGRLGIATLLQLSRVGPSPSKQLGFRITASPGVAPSHHSRGEADGSPACGSCCFMEGQGDLEGAQICPDNVAQTPCHSLQGFRNVAVEPSVPLEEPSVLGWQ